MSRYVYTDDMEELSGFGGGYEAACRAMVVAGLEWFDLHPDAKPDFAVFENVYGVIREDNKDAMELSAVVAGALAGHRTGVHKDAAGRSLLISSEARGVFDDLPKKVVEPEFFSAFIRELLQDEQAEKFCRWMALSIQSLRAGDFSPMWALILAGPGNCGKSLLQHIITELLGGRPCDPYQYLMGEEKFNDETGSSEHWCIADPDGTTDLRTRKKFANRIKEATVNLLIRVHPKNKRADLLKVFRRLTISINDETEELSVCPPMVNAVKDKIGLFKCTTVIEALKPFLDGEGKVSKPLLWAQVLKEIPMIRAWLLKVFIKIPEDQRDTRFGVKAWHHPELFEALASLSPEFRLMQLIDHVYFPTREDLPQTDRKAYDMEQELTAKARDQVAPISKHQNWLGTYLGRLEKAGNPRISRRVKDGTTLWTIKPPVREKAD